MAAQLGPSPVASARSIGTLPGCKSTSNSNDDEDDISISFQFPPRGGGQQCGGVLSVQQLGHIREDRVLGHVLEGPRSVQADRELHCRERRATQV
jgi:hypothetical protein